MIINLVSFSKVFVAMMTARKKQAFLVLATREISSSHFDRNKGH